MKNNQKGATLLEIVVGVALVGMLSTSLFLAFFNASQVMADSKQKIGALSLANERMEIIRNLDYENIGHPEWVPLGPIPQVEVVDLNGFEYTVNTLIWFIDDGFDGIGDEDIYENDYKQVKIEVIWQSRSQNRSVVFVSNFVPKGLESEAGGGVLSVNVIDSLGNPIGGASVRVDSVNESPPIHGTTITDGEGNVRLPGMPEQEYQLTISKSSYETIVTYPDPPVSTFTPLDSNVIIVEGVISKTIIIQKDSSLRLKAQDISDGDSIDEIDIELNGGRLIGSSPETYSFNDTLQTNLSGEIELNNLSPGPYYILNLDSLETSEYRYVGADGDLPIQLQSEESKEVNLLFAPKDENSLLIKVVDDSNGNVLEGALIDVDGVDFYQNGFSTSEGRAFFPKQEDPPLEMISGEYEISVQLSGYQDYSETIDVLDLTELDIALTKN